MSKGALVPPSRQEPELGLAGAFEQAVALLQSLGPYRGSQPTRSELLRSDANVAVLRLALAACKAPCGTPLPAGAGPALTALMRPARGPIVVRAALDAVDAIVPALFERSKKRGVWASQLLAGPQLAQAVVALVSSGSEDTAWRAARALAGLLGFSELAAPAFASSMGSRVGPLVAALAAGMRAGGATRASAARTRREAAAKFAWVLPRRMPAFPLASPCMPGSACMHSVWLPFPSMHVFAGDMRLHACAGERPPSRGVRCAAAGARAAAAGR
jgi:hypothetical protein